MMMHMTFYWGKKVTILFDTWRTESWAGYLLSLLALFVAAVFYQYMEDRRVRFKMLVAEGSKPSSPPRTMGTPLLLPSAAAAARLGNPARLASSLLFGVNSAIGYLLMLAVMSYNSGVFIAVVVGLAVGYLFFRSGGEEDFVALENACACS
ncbi:copper transporter 5.1 [Canna indica]|uniref:Copper transport protein n=1 Tax=Canna indica TaxID=4628 RepID=A0AAQ3QTA7_9LILI|nr:copper transporter 5.1 [Canna indica]